MPPIGWPVPPPRTGADQLHASPTGPGDFDDPDAGRRPVAGRVDGSDGDGAGAGLQDVQHAPRAGDVTLVGEEPIDAYIWDAVQSKLRFWMDDPDGVRTGEFETIRRLTTALMMSGQSQIRH